MSKSLKKILVAGASLLMFASVGAGINSNDNSASANVALTSESQYRKIRGAHVIATRPHGSRRPFGDNTTLGYVNGNSVIVNGNGEVTRIDGRHATRSLFDRVFYHHTAHRRTRRHYHYRESAKERYYDKHMAQLNREQQQEDKKELRDLKESFVKENIRNAYRKIGRQVRIPNQLAGSWYNGKNHEIIFKPFTRRTMNRLTKHVSDNKNSQIINNYLDNTAHEHIRKTGHNQYIISNNHDKYRKYVLSYKVTVLNRNKIKISKYSKNGFAYVPSGIYKRDKLLTPYNEKKAPFPYGITYASRKMKNSNFTLSY